MTSKSENKNDMNLFSGLSKRPKIAIYDASIHLAKRLLHSKYLVDMDQQSYALNPIPYESGGLSCIQYNESEDINHNSGEITILHNKSLLNGLAKYPYRSKYVLFKISPLSIYFYIGLLGLGRRYYIGMVQNNSRLGIVGVKTLTSNIFDAYLIIKNPNSKYVNNFSIDKNIGYGGFLEYLNSTGKQYSVVRFFEKLPNGYRKGGDLDVMVEDDLIDIAADYLSENPGSEMVDMYSVSGPSNAARTPYYTPYLARKILNESVIFNGFSVPTSQNYLNSFIYHCLYHKGLSSGIPTIYKELKISASPDNDYLEKIKHLSLAEGVDTGGSLEELDSYMKGVGWRPHVDTLDLLSTNNKWLLRHLKAEVLIDELTIIICVLKEGFFDNDNLSSFIQSVKQKGFEVLDKEMLRDGREVIAFDHLRGGNWSLTNESKYSPSAVLVLCDSSIDGYLVRKFNLDYNPKHRKRALRIK